MKNLKKILFVCASLIPMLGVVYPSVKAQYVRFEKTGKYLSVAEVLIFSGKKNIAKDGKAVESSIGYGGLPERAIDGDTDGRYSANSVTHTGDADNSPWLQIDLGAEMTIDEIEIWNRTDYKPEQMDGVRVVLLDAARNAVCETKLLDVTPKVRYALEGGVMTKKMKVNATSREDAQKGKPWPDGLRGMQIFPKGSIRGAHTELEGREEGEKMFQNLSKWGVNVVRVNYFNVDEGSPWDVKGVPPPVPRNDPMAPYRKSIPEFKLLMELAEKYRIYVVLCLHTIVGRGYDDTVAKQTVEQGDAGQMDVQEKLWSQFVQGIGDVWEYVANTYKSNPWLIGYDLLNEPHTKKEVKFWQKKMVPEIVERIRAIDQDTWIVVESGPWGSPEGFATMPVLDDPKVVYSFHNYSPHSYCHQGVAGYTAARFSNKSYPGELSQWGDTYTPWGKQELENTMKNAIQFQKKNENSKIFIGEFGVVRWAPGGAQWITDMIDIFEKYRWGWTFHCYGGGWNGWDPALEANDPWGSQLGDKMTDRMKVLLEAWKKNKKN